MPGLNMVGMGSCNWVLELAMPAICQGNFVGLLWVPSAFYALSFTLVLSHPQIVLVFRNESSMHNTSHRGLIPWCCQGKASNAAQKDEGKESGDIMTFNTGCTCIVGRGGRQGESERVMEGND